MTRYVCPNCGQMHTIRLPQASPPEVSATDWRQIVTDLLFGIPALLAFFWMLLMLLAGAR